MLKLRGKPLMLFLGDGSALVTAWLIALTFPPIAPWWLTVVGTCSRHRRRQASLWRPGPEPVQPGDGGLRADDRRLSVADVAVAGGRLHRLCRRSWDAIFGPRQLDAITMATPLDALRTALHTRTQRATVAGVLGSKATFGNIGGKGWEWVAAGYFLGGLYLLQQRIITWHMPAAFLATLLRGVGRHSPSLIRPLCRTELPPVHRRRHAGAFFIVTDPVSGCTTPRGKLIFAAGIGPADLDHPHFGAYPDGIAFAVLLMNIAAPLIDMNTQPPVFGHKGKQEDSR
jgi:electron transport complex protein RnfD